LLLGIYISLSFRYFRSFFFFFCSNFPKNCTNMYSKFSTAITNFNVIRQTTLSRPMKHQKLWPFTPTVRCPPHFVPQKRVKENNFVTYEPTKENTHLNPVYECTNNISMYTDILWYFANLFSLEVKNQIWEITKRRRTTKKQLSFWCRLKHNKVLALHTKRFAGNGPAMVRRIHRF